MMFWLKNFRMRGMQLANTRCWAMYSNYETNEDISVWGDTWPPPDHVQEKKAAGGWLWFSICPKHLWTWPGRRGLVWSVLGAAAGWQRWPSRWSPCVDWRRRRVSCSGARWSCVSQPQSSLTFSFCLTIHIHLKMQHVPVFPPFITSIKMFRRYNIVPVSERSAALEMNLRHLLWQHICKDVDRIRLGFGSWSSGEQDLQQSDLKRERAMKHPPNLLPKWQLSSWCVKHCQEMLILAIVMRSASFLSFWTVNCH